MIEQASWIQVELRNNKDYWKCLEKLAVIEDSQENERFAFKQKLELLYPKKDSTLYAYSLGYGLVKTRRNATGTRRNATEGTRRRTRRSHATDPRDGAIH